MLDAIERRLFAARMQILLALTLITILAAWIASGIKFDADIEKQLPRNHPYVQTALDYKEKIAGLNSIQISVEARHGTIWTPAFLKTFYDVTQEVLFLPSISRESVSSLWTPNTLVYEATENGVEGRTLIPATVLPDKLTAADVARIRADAFKGGYRGKLFALDSNAAIIHAAVLPTAGDGAKTDIIAVAHELESEIRERFENDDIAIRIIGFTKFVGDISNEANGVAIFFVVAFVLNGLALWFFSRSIALTAITILCSIASIVWLFALIRVLGLSLHPLGLIVPFLVYVIGVSHGVQQVNLFLAAIVQGRGSIEAARQAFRRLLVPGFFAIMTVLVAFSAILIIPIPFVQDLALIALVGIALKFIFNLVMLPLAISYVPFSTEDIERQQRLADARRALMGAFSREARPQRAVVVLSVALLIGGVALWQARNVTVGHLKPGAQELWDGARYNVDARRISETYTLDLDSFVIVSAVPVDGCVDYRVMSAIERFGVHMRSVQGVKSVMSLPEAARIVYSIVQEANPKWRVMPKAQDVLALTTAAIPETTGLRNGDCSVMPIALYLTDHRDDTLRNVAAAAEAYVAANKAEGVEFRLATGNGGVLSAINDAVREAQFAAPATVLAVIAILIFVAYRDWRAVLCCVAPLIIASALGLWLMAGLEIGLTVSTLPVLLLGAGIGVDYGLYLYERIEAHLAEGARIDEAFTIAMREEGAAVIYTAVTLALGVGAWAFSGLKFQADMGWLLAFLVFANAFGAVTVLPAMAVILEAVVPRRRTAKA